MIEPFAVPDEAAPELRQVSMSYGVSKDQRVHVADQISLTLRAG